MWISGAISIGLATHFSIVAGLDRRIAAAICLPLIAGCMGLTIKMALGDGNMLQITDGVLSPSEGAAKTESPWRAPKSGWAIGPLGTLRGAHASSVPF